MKNPEIVMWRCCQASLLGFLAILVVVDMKPSTAVDAQFMAEYDRDYAPHRAQWNNRRAAINRYNRLNRTFIGRMQLAAEVHGRRYQQSR